MSMSRFVVVGVVSDVIGSVRVVRVWMVVLASNDDVVVGDGKACTYLRFTIVAAMLLATPPIDIGCGSERLSLSMNLLAIAVSLANTVGTVGVGGEVAGDAVGDGDGDGDGDGVATTSTPGREWAICMCSSKHCTIRLKYIHFIVYGCEADGAEKKLRV